MIAKYETIEEAESTLMAMRDAAKYNQKMEIFSSLDGSHGIAKHNELERGFPWTKMTQGDVERMIKTGDWR
jgi:hypothetical protein